MALSLRSRLTLWYSGLLLLTVVLFGATVLSLYWRFAVKQTDESLEALRATATNVVMAELGEHLTLAEASREMEETVQHAGYAVAVVDAAGRTTRQMPVATSVADPAIEPAISTVSGGDGSRWRLAVHRGAWNGQPFTIAVAAPMQAPAEQWWTLFKASALGIPFVLAIALAGGWAIGRRGLRPLANMADQARTITARAPDSRLVVSGADDELSAVAAAFNRVLDRLGSALSGQRRFMADASHELRTPVSIIATAADVTLSQPARTDAEYREALTAIAQQTARLGGLVDDMLVLARADAGGYPVVRSEVDLDAIVEDCVRELSSRARAKRIRVTARLAPVSAQADETLLRRLLLNLLTNALTYTPAGGAIEVRMVPEGDSIAIRIADTGPGIPHADRERVFERFVRLDPARAEGGAGLGLSIARWVADLHGGRVDLLESGPGGSVFVVTLPTNASAS